MESKNFSKLTQFTNYCAEHPEERFWQALRNWSEYENIVGQKYFGKDLKGEDVFESEDTFYKE